MSARTWLLVVALGAATGCGRLGPGTATSRTVLPASYGGGGGGAPNSGARPGWSMEDGKSCWTNSGGKYCQ